MYIFMYPQNSVKNYAHFHHKKQPQDELEFLTRYIFLFFHYPREFTNLT